MRVYLIVEGQTEEAVTKEILKPHFDAMGIYLTPIIVSTARVSGRKHKGGGRRWIKWKNDIDRILREQKGPEVRVTTLFDLFRLPKGFPGMEEHSRNPDTNRRCDALQDEMARVFDDRRFIPYVQRHELEALVLASLGSLHGLFDAPDDCEGIQKLEKLIGDKPPEDINDGPKTSPSKRLEQYIPGYRKTLHGPMAIQDSGLDHVRKHCPRFDKWVSTLEALSK